VKCKFIESIFTKLCAVLLWFYILLGDKVHC